MPNRRARDLLLLMGGIQYGNRILNTEPDNIIECYPLSDTSGLTAVGVKRGFNGTYSANIDLAAITFPDGTGAPLFNANSEHIQLPAASLDTLWADGIEGTFFLWMKVSAVGVWADGVARFGVSIGTDANNRMYAFKQTAASTFSIVHTAGSTPKTVSFGMSPTTWFSIALTWNKAQDRVIGYLNGVQQGATLTGLGAFTATALANAFSQISSSSTTFYWPGYLKYITLWNKELSAAQILALSPSNLQV